LQKLGVGADGIKTTPLSGEPNLLEGPSPEADQVIQASVESIYRHFLSIVAASRGKTPQQVNAIAQGRVWDGGTARQLGLVDGFGGMEEAIAKAAQLAKLGDDERGVRYLERPESFKDSLLEMLASDDLDESTTDAYAVLGGNPQGQLFRALAELRSILDGPRIQARCLECAADTPVSLSKADRGFLARLTELFL
jgi:protease-4